MSPLINLNRLPVNKLKKNLKQKILVVVAKLRETKNSL